MIFIKYVHKLQNSQIYDDGKLIKDIEEASHSVQKNLHR